VKKADLVSLSLTFVTICVLLGDCLAFIWSLKQENLFLELITGIPLFAALLLILRRLISPPNHSGK
jgi:hypothetical protein